MPVGLDDNRGLPEKGGQEQIQMDGVRVTGIKVIQGQTAMQALIGLLRPAAQLVQFG